MVMLERIEELVLGYGFDLLSHFHPTPLPKWNCRCINPIEDGWLLVQSTG